MTSTHADQSIDMCVSIDVSVCVRVCRVAISKHRLSGIVRHIADTAHTVTYVNRGNQVDCCLQGELYEIGLSESRGSNDNNDRKINNNNNNTTILWITESLLLCRTRSRARDRDRPETGQRPGPYQSWAELLRLIKIFEMYPMNGPRIINILCDKVLCPCPCAVCK